MAEDVYWANVVAAVSSPLLAASGSDSDLMARLTAQAATGDYVGPAVETSDEVVAGRGHEVKVRVYGATSQAVGRPVLVWCHGGGFVGGDIDMPEADATAREVAARADAVVVSVEYRLAVNGVHFPAPFDDAKAVFSWAREQAPRWGADPDRVSLGGASAGAALAAGVCVALRDEGQAPQSLLLLYPIVHPILPAPSAELAAALAGLSPGASFVPEIIKPVVENYMGCPDHEAPPYAMAGVAELAGFPPTLIINCEYDGLRASGEHFGRQLAAAGVEVTMRLATDVLHGHVNSPWLPQAQQSYADMGDWLQTGSL